MFPFVYPDQKKVYFRNRRKEGDSKRLQKKQDEKSEKKTKKLYKMFESFDCTSETIMRKIDDYAARGYEVHPYDLDHSSLGVLLERHIQKVYKPETNGYNFLDIPLAKDHETL